MIPIALRNAFIKQNMEFSLAWIQTYGYETPIIHDIENWKLSPYSNALSLRLLHPPNHPPNSHTHTGAQNGYYIHLIKLYRFAGILCESNGRSKQTKKCSPAVWRKASSPAPYTVEMGKNWLTPRCHSNNNKFWSIQNIHIFIVRQFPRGRRIRASTHTPHRTATAQNETGTVTNLCLLVNGWGWGWVVVANRNGCRFKVAHPPAENQRYCVWNPCGIVSSPDV